MRVYVHTPRLFTRTRHAQANVHIISEMFFSDSEKSKTARFVTNDLC